MKIPYLCLAGAFLVLAVIIGMTSLPVFTDEEEIEKGAGALKYPHLVLGMLAIFMYVGGEVTIGSILVSFFGLENIAGLEKTHASAFLSFYWGGAMIGRFLGAISMSDMAESTKKTLLMAGISIVTFFVIYGIVYLNRGITFGEAAPFLLFMILNLFVFRLGRSLPARTLALFAAVVVCLLAIVIFTEGKIAFWSVIAIGLFNSIMWSNIFTLAIKDLGKYTSQASSLLVMAILGGALVPLVQGHLADIAGVQPSFIVPIFCYLYVLFYGLKGHKVGK